MQCAMLRYGEVTDMHMRIIGAKFCPGNGTPSKLPSKRLLKSVEKRRD